MNRSALQKGRIRASLRLALVRARQDALMPVTRTDVRRVFVFLAADYGNLGDLAITYAQSRFLECAFPDAHVEQVPISRTLGAIRGLRDTIGPSDIIALIGGGNTGDMYDDIQYLRELVIHAFPRNRIISFPQTVEFSATWYGRWARGRARRVYNAHGELTVMARDSKSLRAAREIFDQCRVTLAPDVVLTLDEANGVAERRGILMALRSDLEQGLKPSDVAELLAAARRIGSVRRLDTHVGDIRVDSQQAMQLLNHYWDDLRSAELMITDRLHGMIFSVITGTPCLALDNGTGKVSQFYQDWFKDFPGVDMVSDADALLDKERELTSNTATERAALREGAVKALREAVVPVGP